ncbi:Elongation factor Ts [Chromobacterium violaceum]|uniref:Elongation factor Ts n=1 Tax=Chromobacterium violaceum TaxID=536 RepID=A0A447TCK8_CHRVL|nr:Elongation factor Ts [Chromobacterium violaceum]
MAEITAKMVSDLRVATGLGMMECKKALVEAEGDFAKAEEILRIKSGSKASKMAGRLAAEGIIGSYVEGGVGALVEVNCETDFVAKDPTFIALANAAAKAVAIANPADVEALAAVEVDGQQVEEIRKAAIAKLGENMTIRRFVRYQTEGAISTYLHGAKIA